MPVVVVVLLVPVAPLPTVAPVLPIMPPGVPGAVLVVAPVSVDELVDKGASVVVVPVVVDVPVRPRVRAVVERDLVVEVVGWALVDGVVVDCMVLLVVPVVCPAAVPAVPVPAVPPVTWADTAAAGSSRAAARGSAIRMKNLLILQEA